MRPRNRIWSAPIGILLLGCTGLVFLNYATPMTAAPAPTADGQVTEPESHLERTKRMLAFGREKQLANDAQTVKRVSGLDIRAELVRVEELKAKDATGAQLRLFMKSAEKLAGDICKQMQQAGQRGIPWTVYRLPCAAYEALADKFGVTALSAADRLAYGNWLARMELPLDGERVAAAYQDVLRAKPSPAQEREALLGRLKGLILAEQLAPGQHRDAILAIVDTFRETYSTDETLCDALERTGDYYRWHGKNEEALQFYREAVSRFGGRAMTARDRLQRTAN